MDDLAKMPEQTNNKQRIFGEDLLNEQDDLAGVQEKKPVESYIDADNVKQVSLQLSPLKKIMKDRADKELENEIKFRGNSKERGRLVKIAKLDEKPALEIPPLPSSKRGGPGKNRRRGAISTTVLSEGDELESYSLTQIRQERNKRNFLTALRKTGGNISKACYKAGISRVTIGNWMKNDSYFREEIMELSEAIIDQVEEALLRKIAEGDTYAIIFFLKTQGKKRGYTEKVEFDGIKDEFDKMTDDELLREHQRLEAKIKGREGDS